MEFHQALSPPSCAGLVLVVEGAGAVAADVELLDALAPVVLLDRRDHHVLEPQPREGLRNCTGQFMKTRAQFTRAQFMKTRGTAH